MTETNKLKCESFQQRKMKNKAEMQLNRTRRFEASNLCSCYCCSAGDCATCIHDQLRHDCAVDSCCRNAASTPYILATPHLSALSTVTVNLILFFSLIFIRVPNVLIHKNLTIYRQLAPLESQHLPYIYNITKTQ